MNLLNTVTVNMNVTCGTTIMLERRVEELSGLTEIASLFERFCPSVISYQENVPNRQAFPSEVCVKYNATGGKVKRRLLSQESANELFNGVRLTGALENVNIWFQNKLNNIKYDLYIYPAAEQGAGKMKRFQAQHLKKSMIKDAIAHLKSRKRFKAQLYDQIKTIRENLSRKSQSLHF